MNNQKHQIDTDFNSIGAPFDPYGNDDYTVMNARVMPSQFSYPSMPMNFSLIRNITGSKSDINSFQS
ncbi:MAG: hypothetical protein IJ861_04280 [Clostridia bacterium]|nr:hypothetical protein [Clostridia bacterium]